MKLGVPSGSLVNNFRVLKEKHYWEENREHSAANKILKCSRHNLSHPHLLVLFLAKDLLVKTMAVVRIF